jgi:hypothetical protein
VAMHPAAANLDAAMRMDFQRTSSCPPCTQI